MPKVYPETQSELQRSLLVGTSKLSKIVGATLGPRGRNILIHNKTREPYTTKDGVSVAQNVVLDDPFENAAAQILRQAAEETNKSAGDGTTTSTVLAHAIFSAAQRFLAAGVAPVILKRQIEEATAMVVKNIVELARPISSLEDIENIATISANGDKMIGSLLAMAIDKLGKGGSITIEEARSTETSLDVIEGFQFDGGYVSPKFVTDERQMVVKYDKPLILVTDYALDDGNELIPVLELVAKTKRPFIIVSDSIENQALAMLLMNTIRGSLKVAAIKPPRYGEERKDILKDLAISTGATLITRDEGLELSDIKLNQLGQAKRVEALKNTTTIVGGHTDEEALEKRLASLNAELKQTNELPECEKIQERITRLSSGVAIVYVGGATEVEMVERKYRIEDALEAVKSAQSEGVVVGGGIALIAASDNLSPNKPGFQLIKDACREPMRRIFENAGKSFELLLNLIESNDDIIGFDVAADKFIEEDDSLVIIDPAKVTRCALENAASVACALIMTQDSIIEV